MHEHTHTHTLFYVFVSLLLLHIKVSESRNHTSYFFAILHNCEHTVWSTMLLCGTWDLPGPGLEPMSPALAGGFLTPAPPGKPEANHL